MAGYFVTKCNLWYTCRDYFLFFLYQLRSKDMSKDLTCPCQTRVGHAQNILPIFFVEHARDMLGQVETHLEVIMKFIMVW